MKTIKASKTPIEAIEKLAYPGQDAKRMMYRPGYENYLNTMPKITGDEPVTILSAMVQASYNTTKMLANDLAKESWINSGVPGEKEFDRTIIGIEDAEGDVQGAEFVVARWGNGFSSPVHGHAPGYMHEELLYGKIRVDSYRLIHPGINVVRPVMSQIVDKPGTIVYKYAKPNINHTFKRQNLIHNFTSIGNSATMHFLPEHTRDGRDNSFEVQYFENVFVLDGHVEQITAQQCMHLAPGEIALVRSTNVPEYGDHYILITGPIVKKAHGMRPEEISIPAGPKTILDNYEMKMGVTILKLDEAAKEAFMRFHDLQIQDKQLVLPKH
jgi:hypothetical protein